MTTEEKLRNKMIEEYGSVRNFVKYTDLKYTTVDSILRRGVLNSNVNNVIKICKALGISTDELAKGNIVPAEDPEKEDFDIIEFVKIFRYKLSDPDVAVLDGQHLTENETVFLVNGLDLVIEQIRRMRK